MSAKFCPECGARAKTIDVRDTHDRDGKPYVRRRRECPNCGRRFSTREDIVGFLKFRDAIFAKKVVPAEVPAAKTVIVPARTNLERELEKLRALRGRKLKSGPLFLPLAKANACGQNAGSKIGR